MHVHKHPCSVYQASLFHRRPGDEAIQQTDVKKVVQSLVILTDQAVHIHTDKLVIHTDQSLSEAKVKAVIMFWLCLLFWALRSISAVTDLLPPAIFLTIFP